MQAPLLRPIQAFRPLERFDVFLPARKDWIAHGLETGRAHLHGGDELRLLDKSDESSF